MKKLVLFLLALVAIPAISNAQAKGGNDYFKTRDLKAGINLNLGTGDNLTMFGIGAKAQYTIAKNVRLEAAFDYYFNKKQYFAKTSMFDIMVSGQYLFNVGVEKLRIYPIVGFGITHVKVKMDKDFNLDGLLSGMSMTKGEGDFEGEGDFDYDYSDVDLSASTTDFTFAIGAGAEYALSKSLYVNLDLKYHVVNNYNRFVPSLGITYRF